MNSGMLGHELDIIDVDPVEEIHRPKVKKLRFEFKHERKITSGAENGGNSHTMEPHLQKKIE